MPEVWTGGGRGAGDGPLVSNLVAHGSQVAVIGGDVHGDIIFGGELRTPRDLVLDFSALIKAATRRFVGRQEVFTELAAFADTHACGYIDIEGDAGLGKTALAAAIASRLDAIAFFASGSRGLTLPKQFLTHTCAALITRHALPYDHLPSRAGEDGAFLARLLDEVSARASGPSWIVVDALDEAEPPPPRANALLLPTHLPAGVFVVVTQRPAGRIWTQPDTPRLSIELRADAPEQRHDLENYIRVRAEDARLQEALRTAQPPVDPDALVQTLSKASRGNFMYVSYVLGDIEAHVAGTPLDLSRLPDGLEGYYEQFWADIVEAKKDWADWKGLYRPVVERLAVAAEAVTPAWLGAQVGRDPDEVRERALLRWERLLSQETTGGEERWRVVHRSFADFLASKVDLPAAHRAVAAFYADARWGQWAQFDTYGLRHTPGHLAAAAAGAPNAATRRALGDTLARLVLDPGYQQQHLSSLRDPLAFEEALALALKTLAADPEVPVPQLAAVALRLVAFRKEQRQPGPIFDLAIAGDVDAAERRLDLFALDVDANWYDALLLTIAWVAAPRNGDAARRLRDRVRTRRAALPADEGIDLLLARVSVVLDGAPMPPLTLPAPPPLEEGQAIVLRLQASSIDQSMMSGAAIELLSRRELTAGPGGYLAQDDAPDLVALALHEPSVGEPLLAEYIALHAAYGYREYRQASLAWLLRAVLQHPSQDWVVQRVLALGAAVLAPNRGEFRGSLALAVTARQAAAGDAAAAAALQTAYAESSTADPETLPLPMPARGGGSGPGRQAQGDAWGTRRRSLSALAEALSCVPGREDDARALLPRALAVQWGFAGFNAPACLALADAIAVVAFDAAEEQRALSLALMSAHNIQDATFCVRTTARVQALRDYWSQPPGGFDVQAAAARLGRDPAAPEFCALHVVGQGYENREAMATVPLGDDVRNAATLRDLATIYARPLDDVIRANSGSWAADDRIPPGTTIEIPDPGFPPLLGARLAARALADTGLTPGEREATSCGLVPLVAADATALDLVLARLVLASPRLDDATLRALAPLAAPLVEEPADAPLNAQLTRFIP